MTRMIWFLLGVCLAGPVLRAATSCEPVTEDRKAALSKYIERKYRLGGVAAIMVTETTGVAGTCYVRVRFRSENPQNHFDVALYLSPDHRFLTTDLNDSSVDPAAAEKERLAATRRLVEKDGAASRGPSRAPVTIVLFSDFQCPFCAQLAKALESDILGAERENIRVAFRHFPLEMHPWARQAAETAACAHEQGDRYFWEVHDHFFEKQREIAADRFQEQIDTYAGLLDGFDVARFKSCVNGRQSAAAVENDITLGKELGVGATPTLFINGQRLPGYRPEQVRTLIRELTSAAQPAAQR